MSTPQPPGGGQGSAPDANYRAILDYLAKRGHHKAALALSSDLEHNQAQGQGQAQAQGPAAGKAVALDDFAERNAPSAPRQPQQPQQRRRMDQSVAPGQMLADPPSWEKGYEGIRAFVDNSLDIHRPELQPLLLPLFVHSYLDLVLVGYRDAADHFLTRFASDHAPLYPALLRLLSSLRLPSHVSENEAALRWRHERYHVRLSERGWGLLLGWLQGGGIMHGASEGTEGRGRDRVLAIINERVKVDAVPGPPLSDTLTSHGLASDYAALSRGGAPPPLAAPYADGAAPELRLGPGRVNAQLEREVKRRLKDAGEDDAADDAAAAAKDEGSGEAGAAAGSAGEAGADGAAAGAEAGDGESTPADEQAAKKAPADELISPFPAELPPYPSTFRTLDVAREVEKVREARKRIRLGPEAYAPDGALIPAQRAAGAEAHGGALGAALLGGEGRVGGGEQARREDQRRGVGKPSVCLFTLHDTGDSLSTVTFSEDSTVMATGFTESYIRLWSLDGKGLRALRTDLSEDEVGKIHDAAELAKLYHPDAPQTRKLIAHSGPVYSLSFDPVPGPAGPPRYLLSASADTTVRLWSLETYQNLVVYRGHREPVWAVEWGPRGVYFATASRDRTARLWITDKVNAVRIFAGHLSDVNCLSFHPNSLYLATGSSDRTCRLWDVQKGHCVRVFVGHRAAVQVVRCSPDGRYLASAGDDGLVLIWSLATGARIKTFYGHAAPINALAWSAESSLVVSGAADDTVRVWDVATPPGDGANPEVPSAQGVGAGSGGAAAAAAAQAKRLVLGSGADVKRRASAAAGMGRLGGGAGGAGADDAGAKARGDGLGLGLIPRAQAGEGPCADLLATLATKRTPVLEVKFTPRNLCLAAGAMREAPGST
ncbi:hypothetical protein JCM3770_000064 [Rhodotorula araucariae]